MHLANAKKQELETLNNEIFRLGALAIQLRAMDEMFNMLSINRSSTTCYISRPKFTVQIEKFIV